MKLIKMKKITLHTMETAINYIAAFLSKQSFNSIEYIDKPYNRKLRLVNELIEFDCFVGEQFTLTLKVDKKFNEIFNECTDLIPLSIFGSTDNLISLVFDFDDEVKSFSIEFGSHRIDNDGIFYNYGEPKYTIPDEMRYFMFGKEFGMKIGKLLDQNIIKIVG